ncbi:LPXTG cell wall anchor domain-containing protein [Enterococcus faecalis]|uniref:LPXTG cell wall anchor domain-containing protein n=1 Tax=Enterococcus faecalis TaxID=1351 RepID=UPI001F40BC76|nr:LPXTG cell wall anchor domain-containing protein [Enterococcus faecalis]
MSKIKRFVLISIFSLCLAVFVLPVFVIASTETTIHVTRNLDPIDTEGTQDSPKQEETLDRKLTVLRKGNLPKTGEVKNTIALLVGATVVFTIIVAYAKNKKINK